MAPEVSVIIPAFDRAAVLPRAIDSALAQAGPSLEIVVADDGSGDATPEILSRYARDPRVRALRLAHGGVSRARNAAVAEARAPLLAFLDSDDEWLPGKLAAQCALLRGTGLSICQTEEIWIRNGLRVNPPAHYVKRGGDLFAPSLRHCMLTPSSTVMTRALYESAGGFDPDFPACEDFEFWLRIVPDHEVGLVPKPYMVRYGGHADQLSMRYPAQDRFRIRALALMLERNGISADRRPMVLEALEEKLGIYETGCRKRGNEQGLAWCAAVRAARGTGTVPGVTL
jgi:glycosyltransferase involved in cell wall biosynthesis